MDLIRYISTIGNWNYICFGNLLINLLEFQFLDGLGKEVKEPGLVGFGCIQSSRNVHVNRVSWTA